MSKSHAKLWGSCGANTAAGQGYVCTKTGAGQVFQNESQQAGKHLLSHVSNKCA